MGYLVITVLSVMVFGLIFKATQSFIEQRGRRRQNSIGNYKLTGIFYDTYIEVKAFYLQEFKITPNISFMDGLDGTRVYDFVEKGNAGKVLSTHQRNYFNWKEGRQQFSITIFKLENNVMIELGQGYAEILFSATSFGYAGKLVEALKAFKVAGKKDDYEINIITLTQGSLELKRLDVKPTSLDVDLYYNNDFKCVDEVIRQRLSQENDKGIVLLHGLPGTGKTTYLRYLIGTLKKKVLFVSPAVAGNLMNPEFIDLLIDNPNSVLVIEDAENIIMDRKYSNNSSVSNLLNISDGLLSDCLNVQIICTFNISLSLVDSALMRKGRLIAKYEFVKLDVRKAQILSDHLGLKQEIQTAMSLAEITNPGAVEYQPAKVNIIGFRRLEEEYLEN